MLPNSLNQQPPKEVQDLLKEYKEHMAERELIIADGLFLLYEKAVETVTDQPDKVSLGKFIRRAYWADAGNMTPEMVKARLRL